MLLPNIGPVRSDDFPIILFDARPVRSRANNNIAEKQSFFWTM